MKTAPLVLVIACAATVACKQSPSATPQGEVDATPPAPAPASAPTNTTFENEPPAQERPRDKLDKAVSLAEALAIAKPMMVNSPLDEHNAGTQALSHWASTKLTWQDVGLSKNETSIRLVRKDLEEEAAKRMCVSGFLVQISKTTIDGHKFFRGLLSTWNGDLISFWAFGSTGQLVIHSNARFCGIVTGLYDYSNSGGGTSHAIELVGMFDLPKNRESALKQAGPASLPLGSIGRALGSKRNTGAPQRPDLQ